MSIILRVDGLLGKMDGTVYGEQVIVSVNVGDMGPGISAEVGKQLFKSFFTTKVDGLGMGLNICRTIIENHGGQLLYENRFDQGVVFSFTIPRHI